MKVNLTFHQYCRELGPCSIDTNLNVLYTELNYCFGNVRLFNLSLTCISMSIERTGVSLSVKYLTNISKNHIWRTDTRYVTFTIQTHDMWRSPYRHTICDVHQTDWSQSIKGLIKFGAIYVRLLDSCTAVSETAVLTLLVKVCRILRDSACLLPSLVNL